MRRHSRSVLIYTVFGVIIATFVISFGPQAGQGMGCTQSGTWAVKVGDSTVSEHSWRFGLNGLFGGKRSKRDRALETVMDRLIEREILAQGAESAGMRLSDDEIARRVASGEYYILGDRRMGEYDYFTKTTKEAPGRFQKKRLELLAKNAFQLPSLDAFIREQRREMMAQGMRDLIERSVRVSVEETQSEYIQQHSGVSVQFLRFETETYAKKVDLTSDEIGAYATAHEADLKKDYDADSARYKGAPKEIRLRHIFFEKPADEEMKPEEAPVETPPEQPAPEAAAADAGPATAPAGDAGAAPAEVPPEGPAHPTKVKAEQALARLMAGEPFAVVARELSDDVMTREAGGLIDWKPESTLVRWGDQFVGAVGTMKAGDPPNLVESDRGWHIVVVEGRREGDLTFEQVKLELAEKKLKREKAQALAKAAAEETLAKVTAGESMDVLYPERDPEPVEGIPLAPVDPDRPRTKTAVGLKKRGDTVSGRAHVGKSKELAKAVFTDLAEGQVGSKAFEVDDGDAYVVAKVVEREEPDMAQFEKDKADLMKVAARERASAAVRDWVKRRCLEVAPSIAVNPTYIEYDADTKSTYQPCVGSSLDLGGMEGLEGLDTSGIPPDVLEQLKSQGINVQVGDQPPQ